MNSHALLLSLMSSETSKHSVFDNLERERPLAFLTNSCSPLSTQNEGIKLHNSILSRETKSGSETLRLVVTNGAIKELSCQGKRWRLNGTSMGKLDVGINETDFFSKMVFVLQEKAGLLFVDSHLEVGSVAAALVPCPQCFCISQPTDTHRCQDCSKNLRESSCLYRRLLDDEVKPLEISKRMSRKSPDEARVKSSQATCQSRHIAAGYKPKQLIRLIYIRPSAIESNCPFDLQMAMSELPDDVLNKITVKLLNTNTKQIVQCQNIKRVGRTRMAVSVPGLPAGGWETSVFVDGRPAFGSVVVTAWDTFTENTDDQSTCDGSTASASSKQIPPGAARAIGLDIPPLLDPRSKMGGFSEERLELAKSRLRSRLRGWEDGTPPMGVCPVRVENPSCSSLEGSGSTPSVQATTRNFIMRVAQGWA